MKHDILQLECQIIMKHNNLFLKCQIIIKQYFVSEMPNYYET